MKKLVSLLMVVCMIVSLFTFGPIVSASGEDSGAQLIFDMELQGADGVLTGVTDSANGGYFKELDLEKNVNLPALKTVEGITTNYLEFATLDESDNPVSETANRGLYLTFNTDAEHQLADVEDRTIEMWVRMKNKSKTWGPLIRYGDSYGTTSNSGTAFRVSTKSEANVCQLDADHALRSAATTSFSKYSSKDITLTANEWVHYAFVFDWIPNETNTTTPDYTFAKKGHWMYTIYENGRKKAFSAELPGGSDDTDNGIERLKYGESFKLGVPINTSVDGWRDTRYRYEYNATNADLVANILELGTQQYCDIADVKIYSGVREETEINTTYKAELKNFSGYMTTPVFKSGKKNIVGEVTNPETETTLADADNINVFATTNADAFVALLAVYDTNHNLIKVANATTAINEGMTEISADTGELGLAEGVTIGSASLFVWEDFTTIAPLFKADLCL